MYVADLGSMETALNTHETTTIAPRAYRVRDFCRAFGLGRTKTYALIATGELPSIKVAGCRLILADAAEKLLKGEK
jgi:hypothetical protein